MFSPQIDDSPSKEQCKCSVYDAGTKTVDEATEAVANFLGVGGEPHESEMHKRGREDAETVVKFVSEGTVSASHLLSEIIEESIDFVNGAAEAIEGPLPVDEEETKVKK